MTFNNIFVDFHPNSLVFILRTSSISYVASSRKFEMVLSDITFVTICTYVKEEEGNFWIAQSTWFWEEREEERKENQREREKVKENEKERKKQTKKERKKMEITLFFYFIDLNTMVTNHSCQ